MERRNRSIKALSELIYIDSLESFDKADALVEWFKEYLEKDSIENFDLNLEELKSMEELFFKNINFLKKQQEITKEELLKTQKLKRFLKN
ncbi:hypothetical protein [Arcobacter aquimarinus]|uniref:hypothetical protein n=1 Tax=Arcobacter aquimarinus TaxID=1315211 RepID=UPI003542DD56